MSSELTNRIRVFRAEHELSQSALADHIGVTRKTISTIEVGLFVPSTIIALKLADHFNVPVEEIFTLVKEPAPEKTKARNIKAGKIIERNFLMRHTLNPQIINAVA